MCCTCFYRCFGSSGSLSLGDALGQHCHQKVSFGPSACYRHHHVAKDIRARVHTATITRHEQRFRIVPRNTMPVLSVMKVRSGRLSVRSCHHQGGCMLSRALTHRTTYVAVLGGGETTNASDAQGAEARRKRECHKTEAKYEQGGNMDTRVPG